MKQIITLILVGLFLANPLFAQDLKTNFKAHVETLSSDEMEGRKAGSEGEKLAAKYITGELAKMNLLPVGPINYLQPFRFIESVLIEKETSLALNDVDYKIKEDFIPLNKSGNGNVTALGLKVGYGIEDTSRNDYEDVFFQESIDYIFFIEASHPGGFNHHGQYAISGSINKKVSNAVKRGAKGIVFYTSDKKFPVPEDELKPSNHKWGVPVVFLKGDNGKRLKTMRMIKASMQVDLTDNYVKANNIMGLINNGAEKTIILGAHYDHLGYGGHGSLHRGKEEIHNGADDNASGCAMLLELARTITQESGKFNAYNYLFVFFSAEELGLLGSDFYVKNPVVQGSSIKAMLNFDMVGRLEETLIVNGTGTAKEWNKHLKRARAKGFKIKKNASGIGPSDHTKFYLDSVPVLAFFTGSHPDYHKPSDDAHLVNYDGMVSIHAYVERLLRRMHKRPKLRYMQTNDPEQKRAPKFNVTLGIIPDYAYTDKGLRLDGVSSGKVAETAGLQAGDILVKMGEIEINDIYDYMKALSVFSPGDQIKVKVLRDGKELTKTVNF